MSEFKLGYYLNDPKFSDRYASANIANPDQTAPQGLHCLPFRLHHLDSLLYGRATKINFRVITTNFWVSEYLGNLRYTSSGRITGHLRLFGFTVADLTDTCIGKPDNFENTVKILNIRTPKKFAVIVLQQKKNFFQVGPTGGTS